MAMSVAELYLHVFRRGVRIEVRSSVSEIKLPDDLSSELRYEIDARRAELDHFLRRLRGLAVGAYDDKFLRQSATQLSHIEFDRKCLILVKSGDVSSALFFPHSLSGVAAPSEGLSRLFPPEQAAFGFQALGLTDDRSPLSSIEEMASYYTAQMRLVVPRGPYFLCGWSTGGYIAFEMARQIYAAGERIGLLVIIDSQLPSPQASMRERWLTFHRYAKYVNKVREVEIFDPSHPFWQLDDEDRLSFIHSILMSSKEGTLPRNIGIEELKKYFMYFNSICDAQEKYVPQYYPGPVTFLQAEESASASAGRWAKLTGNELRIVMIPGGHLSLMEYHNRGVVCEKLAECLKAAHQSAVR